MGNRSSTNFDFEEVMDSADLQAELKSNRRGSLSGGVGFHETVQQVVEVSDREYYSFLNLTPDCTDDEIKVAHKRLALLNEPGNIVTVALQRFGLEV